MGQGHPSRKCGRCHAIEAVGGSPLNKAPPMRDIYARFNPRELRAELFQLTNWDRFVLGHAVSIVPTGPEDHHDHPATYKVGRQSFSELPSDRHGVSANASKTKPSHGRLSLS
jgi:hypothetical protein